MDNAFAGHCTNCGDACYGQSECDICSEDEVLPKGQCDGCGEKDVELEVHVEDGIELCFKCADKVQKIMNERY